MYSAVIREEVAVQVTPNRLPEGGESKYLLMIPGGQEITYLQARYFPDQTKGSAIALDVTEIERDSKEYVDVCGTVNGLGRCYWVHGWRAAGVSLAVGKSVQLVIGWAKMHGLRPVPEVNEQNEPLRVLLEDNAYFWSPYKTMKQQTSMMVASKFVILSKECPRPNQLDKPVPGANVLPGMSQFICGVYNDVGPMEKSRLRMHYIMPDTPMATMTNVDRHLTVLPWFNVLQVTEKIRLRHDGFKLKDGKCSRSQFLRSIRDRNLNVQVIGMMPFLVPSAAYDVDVRDENGRLTGQVNRGAVPGFGHLHQINVAPRYPLYGGWSWTFEFSYKVPLSSVLSSSGANKQLTVPLFQTHFDLPIEQFSIKINLPEDAELIGIKSDEFKHLEPTVTRYKTYLSTKGELAVELLLENLVKEHGQNIKITYAYPWWGIFRKPLVILLSLILAIIMFQLGSSIDLSLGRSTSTKARLLKLFKERREMLCNLDDLLAKPTSKPAEKDAILKALQSVTEEIMACLKAGGESAFNGVALRKLYEEHLTSVSAVFNGNTAGSTDARKLDATIQKWEAKCFVESKS